MDGRGWSGAWGPGLVPPRPTPPPNPNLEAPPFVDGWPIPASTLNNLFSFLGFRTGVEGMLPGPYLPLIGGPILGSLQVTGGLLIGEAVRGMPAPGGINASNYFKDGQPLAAADLTLPLSIGDGGTGSTDAPSALSNLGGLPIAGGTMEGALVLLGAPTQPNEASTKGYVDGIIADMRVFQGTWRVAANIPNLVTWPKSDGNYFLAVTANSNVPEIAPAVIPGIGGQTIDNGDMIIWDAISQTYELIRGGPLNKVEADELYVSKTGDIMTGPLVLPAFPAYPTQPNEAVNKAYVDSRVGTGGGGTGSALTGVIAGAGLVGGGSTGNVTLAIASSVNLTGIPTAPTAAAGNNSTQIATTAFVRNAVGSGGGGTGTITGVLPGSGLTGGGTSGNVTLSIATNVSLPGAPTTATAAAGTNTTQIATTAFVRTAVQAIDDGAY